MRRIYRTDDRVKIINPEVFLRCGYPIDIRAETERLQKIHELDVMKLIDKIDQSTHGPYPGLAAIFNRIAYTIAARNSHGGNERKIYTRRDESLAGLECCVMGKRVVKTGIRYGPSYYGDDYEPGGLNGCKTHVILKVFIVYKGVADFDTKPMLTYADGFEIERDNVEPYDLTPTNKPTNT